MLQVYQQIDRNDIPGVQSFALEYEKNKMRATINQLEEAKVSTPLKTSYTVGEFNFYESIWFLVFS